MIRIVCYIIVFLAIGEHVISAKRATERNDEDLLDDNVRRATNDDDNVIDIYKRNVPHDYNTIIDLSLKFYEAQKSGTLPDNNRIKWRGDSALNDTGDNGEDLTGGWYDAGDNLKFNLPMAYSTSVIGYGIMLFKDGYKSAGKYWKAMDQIKWTCDYFIKCHTKPNEYYYQVGDDHAEWIRPEDMLAPRPAFKVDSTKNGSDVLGMTAAALATCGMVWETRDATYSAECIQHAEDLYTMGMTNQGVYPSDVYYTTTKFGDELAWAAGLLYLATGNTKYLNESEALFNEYRLFGRSRAFGWADVREAVKVLLYEITNTTRYYKAITKYIDRWLPGGGTPYTAGGMAFRDDWGSLRYSSGTAFIALLAANIGIDPNGAYTTFACNQTNYILGNNPNNQSYVIGYGNNSPKSPHHRASSCPAKFKECTLENSFGSATDNPNLLEGALVGGPDEVDWYEDSRYDYIQNEVACDYNAAFQSTIAALETLNVAGTLPEACKIL